MLSGKFRLLRYALVVIIVAFSIQVGGCASEQPPQPHADEAVETAAATTAAAGITEIEAAASESSAAAHEKGVTDAAAVTSKAPQPIEAAPILAESIELTNTTDLLSNELYVLEAVRLDAQVQPHNTTDKTVTWSSDNTAVATVANGIVRGVSAGTATIRATASNSLQAAYEVTVKALTRMMTVTVSCDYRVNKTYQGSTYFSVDGMSVGSGSTVPVTLGRSLGVWSEVTVLGSVSNTESASELKYIDGCDFENGFEISKRIVLSINGDSGREEDTAIFYIDYKFKPAE